MSEYSAETGRRTRRTSSTPQYQSSARRLGSSGFLTLGLIVMWLGVIVVSIWPKPSEPIPDELVGVWKTTAPRYADRAFEITKTSVTFHTGDGGFTIHPIDRVKRFDSGNATLFTVDYTNQGDTYTFSFYYQPEPAREIRFQNQREMVWTKEQ